MFKNTKLGASHGRKETTHKASNAVIYIVGHFCCSRSVFSRISVITNLDCFVFSFSLKKQAICKKNLKNLDFFLINL
jgi:hypothetical protein